MRSQHPGRRDDAASVCQQILTTVMDAPDLGEEAVVGKVPRQVSFLGENYQRFVAIAVNSPDEVKQRPAGAAPVFVGTKEKGNAGLFGRGCHDGVVPTFIGVLRKGAVIMIRMLGDIDVRIE